MKAKLIFPIFPYECLLNSWREFRSSICSYWIAIRPHISAATTPPPEDCLHLLDRLPLGSTARLYELSCGWEQR